MYVENWKEILNFDYVYVLYRKGTDVCVYGQIMYNYFISEEVDFLKVVS